MFNDYEKVQDLLMYLGKEWKVTFNVLLGSKDRMGNRKFFYSEYQYQSRYIDVSKVVSVKRNFKTFMTIEQINNYQNSIMITRADMPILRNVVTEATSWLTNSNIFGLDKDGKATILTDVSSQCNIGSNSAVKFEPMLLLDQYNVLQPGIRMYINDERNYINVESRDFYSFYELLRTIDFYTAGCAVIAGLPITHEDAAINRSDLEIEAEHQFDLNKNTKKPGFFDK